MIPSQNHEVIPKTHNSHILAGGEEEYATHPNWMCSSACQLPTTHNPTFSRKLSSWLHLVLSQPTFMTPTLQLPSRGCRHIPRQTMTTFGSLAGLHDFYKLYTPGFDVILMRDIPKWQQDGKSYWKRHASNHQRSPNCMPRICVEESWWVNSACLRACTNTLKICTTLCGFPNYRLHFRNLPNGFQA